MARKATDAAENCEQHAGHVDEGTIWSPFPGVIPIPQEEVEVLGWTRSNDPAVLDSPRIKMTLAERGLENGFPRIYQSSKIRRFSYPERNRPIEPWPNRRAFGDVPKDKYHDFSSALNDEPFYDAPYPHESCPVRKDRPDPNLLSYPVGKMDPREVEEYVGDPTLWFRYDYLSFYTHWSQMCASQYDDKSDKKNTVTT